MNKNRRHRMWGKMLSAFFLLAVIFFASCDDDDDNTVVKGPPHDPNKPVEFVSYSPDSGGVGTKIIIRGTNFGNDTALIKVSVNGKDATVIGVNDTHLYAVVPARADTGLIAVEVAGKSHTFEEEFLYQFKRNVTTFAGKTNADGNSEYKDGPITEAMFNWPRWLLFDRENTMYVMEDGDNGRKGGLVVIENGSVSRPMRVGGSIARNRSIDFNLTQDTMYMTNDGGGPALLYLLRDNGFMTFRPFYNMENPNFAMVNPLDGELFFNQFNDGEVFRWDRATQKPTPAFWKIRDAREEMHLVFTPDGMRCYINIQNKSVIYKAEYDPVNKVIKEPIFLAGKYDEKGFKDGFGGDARFNEPCQMVVDENGDCLVADKNNHRIRRITWDGNVTTYAGSSEGYGDGEPLLAKFKSPEGLAWSPAPPVGDGALYVAESGNHRIRRILIE